ncbi:hypothetical protein D3C85_1409320 [compost metagenome]
MPQGERLQLFKLRLNIFDATTDSDAVSEILRTAHFIQHHLEMSELKGVDTHKDEPIVCQQPMQQFQARIHHAQPFIVAT